MILKLRSQWTALGVVSLFCCTVLTGNVLADEPMSQQEFDQALQALPEVADDLVSLDSIRASTPRMKCFVDTFAFDLFSFGFCANNGTPRTTTAVFRIDSPPSNFTILWSDSRCDSSRDTCFLPIRHFQQINLSATVLNNANNTFSTTSASALYESFE